MTQNVYETYTWLENSSLGAMRRGLAVARRGKVSRNWTLVATRGLSEAYRLDLADGPSDSRAHSGGLLKVQSAEAVVRLMVAKDPQQTADTILAFLMGVNHARAGAVFSVADGHLRLFVGHRIGQDAIDHATERWSTDQRTLAQGRLSRSDDRFLVPILRGERLVAVVFLTAAQLDLASIAEVAGLVGEAVLRGDHQPAHASPVEEYLEKTPAEEIGRRKLLILLERHEWNVARVARELRVTRTTIYKRLESFGISRKRVTKDRREACPLPTSS